MVTTVFLLSPVVRVHNQASRDGSSNTAKKLAILYSARSTARTKSTYITKAIEAGWVADPVTRAPSQIITPPSDIHTSQVKYLETKLRMCSLLVKSDSHASGIARASSCT